MKEDSISKTN